MIRIKAFTFVALAGIAMLLPVQACVADTAQAPTPLGSFTLSFQPASGNPIVNVKADGQFAGVFALDTGCTYDFISSSFAAKLDAPVDSVQLRMDDSPNDPPQTMTAALVNSLTVGTMTWTKRGMIVLDDQNLDFPPDIPMDGIIGLGTLYTYAMLIDPTSKSVTIYDSKVLTNSSISALGFDATESIPMTRSLADGFYHVQASVENDGHTASVDLELDTCDHSTQILQTIADRLHVKLGHRIDQPTMFSGDAKERECTVQKLIIGNVTVSNLSLISVDNDNPRDPPDLGRDVLFGCRVLFDFPDSKMYLAPPSTPTTAPATAQPSTSISPGSGSP